MNTKKKRPQLVVALDVNTLEEARRLIDALSPAVDIFKVGSHLFTSCGPVAVRFIQARGKKVFLDLKYHDIPNTVANAVRVAVNLSSAVHTELKGMSTSSGEKDPSIFMYTLHTAGGLEMLKTAVEAGTQEAERIDVTKPLSLGITVLTSQEKGDNIHELVLERALLARKAGLDGVVSSCEEVELIRREMGEDFIIVTPGIRPQGSQKGDQKRVATPQKAVSLGSDFLVVGRPIVQSPNPLAAAQEILKEMEN